MCYGKITQCQRCGSIDAPIPAFGPGRCDQISMPNYTVIGPSTDIPTCSSCQNQDLQIIQALQAAAEHQRQEMILRDEELQRIQAQEAKDRDILPESFKTWCTENNATQLSGSGFSAESALDADIRDYLEYLQDGPFDLEYRDEFQFRIEEMRASENANFDFAPYEQPYLNRLQRWMRFMEADGNFLADEPIAVEADPIRRFQRIVAIYAGNLSPMDQVSFLAARETLAVNDRLELYGEPRQDHTISPRGEWIPISSTDLHVASSVKPFAEWVSRQDAYHSMFNNILPRQALLRNISNYQTEIIAPLGPSAEALAWHNLIHNIKLAAEQLFDFLPQVNTTPLPSFLNFRTSEASVYSSYSFDAALTAYESYLMRAYPVPSVLDSFRAAINDWTAADRSQLEGLPRVDYTMIRLRTLSNHFTHLLNAATAVGRGAVVREVVMPAQRMLKVAMEHVFWLSRGELKMLQKVFDQGWDVVAPGSERPRLDGDELEEMMFEYEELGWDNAGNLYSVRRYWTSFEG